MSRLSSGKRVALWASPELTDSASTAARGGVEFWEGDNMTTPEEEEAEEEAESGEDEETYHVRGRLRACEAADEEEPAPHTDDGAAYLKTEERKKGRSSLVPAEIKEAISATVGSERGLSTTAATATTTATTST